MTQIKIKKARIFPSGEQFFPITHTKAVIDDNGNNIDSILNGKQDEIKSVTITVDDNVGIPSGSVTLENDTLAFNFQNLKGADGVDGLQGPKGDTVTATDYTLYNVQGSDSSGAMSQDATTKAISAQTGYYTCGTAASTAAKVVTVENGNIYKMTLGGHFKVKMTNSNTAASGVTLKVGSETATTLYYNGEAVSESNTWEAEEIISVFYDGTRFMASNSQGGGGKAEKIKYDNLQSGLSAENMQEAVDELHTSLEELDEQIIDNKSVIEEDEEVVARLALYIRNNFALKNEVPDTSDFAAKSDLVDDELVIAKAFVQMLGGGTANVKGTVTIKNSDTITVFGSSYGTGVACINGKHWTNNIAALSDYQFQNLSFDGNNNVMLLNKVRAKTIVPKGRYAMLACNENLPTVSKSWIQAKSTENLGIELENMGIEPIVCNSYRYSTSLGGSLQSVAMKHHWMCWDASEYCALFLSAMYSGFNGSYHLGTRNISMVSDSYWLHHKHMERPRQSLKVFRIRGTVTVNSLDDLMFNNNADRDSLFRELFIGTTTPDEYSSLGNNVAVAFHDYALASCVLPCVGKDLENVKINIEASKSVNVYLKDVDAEPHPVISNTKRFSVNETITLPTIGSVYSVSGTNVTVQAVVEGEQGYFCTIYVTPANISVSSTGTLTKVSGTGSDTINYVLAEDTSLDVGIAILNETNGHWAEITGEDGVYTVPTRMLRTAITYDKMDILIEGDGDFNLTNIEVTYAGSREKCIHRNYDKPFESNIYSSRDEYISEPTFGTAGTVSSFWKDGNGNFLTSVNNWEKAEMGKTCYPVGCSSIYKVNSLSSINASIPNTAWKGGNAMLEVWCRYFPPLSAQHTETLTVDDYGCARLYVEFAGAKFTEPVGLMWKAVRIPISIYNVSNSLPLKIYADKDVDISMVSMINNN